jgi:hypothetical protein
VNSSFFVIGAPPYYKKEDNEMPKNEKSSKRLGTLASKVLRSKKSSKDSKSLAGSVLTQRPDRKKKSK